MIENVSIFTKSGLVLWEHKESEISSDSVNPIDHLVMEVFLEEKMHKDHHEYGGYLMNWTFENERNLIFVLAYKSTIQAVSSKYYLTLLETLKQDFVRNYAQVLQHRELDPYLDVFKSFNTNFGSILQTWKQTLRKDRQQKRTGESMRGYKKKEKSKQEKEDNEDLERQQAVENLHRRSKRKKMRTFDQSSKKKKKKKKGGEKPVKVKREWKTDPSSGIKKFNEKDAAALRRGPELTEDESKQKEMMARITGVNDVEKVDTELHITSDEEEEEEVEEEKEEEKKGEEDYMPNKRKDVKVEEEEEEDEDEDEDEDEVVEIKKKAKKGMIGKFFSSLSGKRKLEKDDLRPVMRGFRNHLVSKNVAEDVAQKICDSVQQSLLGKNMGRVSTVHGMVKTALLEALTRILSPARPIRIKKDIMEAKERKEPYSIVFCGVNGVGKSTSLSKIAFWLKSEGFSVIMCACDTFRSGAVEQLRKHADCLEVPLFERGYGRDAFAVARDGIQYARANEIDVILIDTAGRMQSNEPLMVSLGKLIEVNTPNLVLFVGEALVGNQGVDQLVKFDLALKNYSKNRQIDGILLTKFDTIDDKVGAAVSMVYISSHPIVFIGTGQKYYHLKKLAPKNVVHFLLK